MGKIYAGQDVKVRLTVGQDITGASVKKIRYIAPDKTTGDKDAEVEDAVNGIIYAEFPKTETNIARNWIFWTFIIFNDGKSAPGETIMRYFYPEGS